MNILQIDFNITLNCDYVVSRNLIGAQLKEEESVCMCFAFVSSGVWHTHAQRECVLIWVTGHKTERRQKQKEGEPMRATFC